MTTTRQKGAALQDEIRDSFKLVAPAAFRKIADEASPYTTARPFDCFAAYKGVPIYIECKHYSTFPIPLSILKPHQAAALVDFDLALANTPHFCGIALRVGIVRALVPISVWKSRSRGSFDEEKLAEWLVERTGKRWAWPEKAISVYKPVSADR